MLANALRRAIRTGEQSIVPRISDLAYIYASFQGKVEFEAMEEGREDKILERLIQNAVKSVFDRYVDMNLMETTALEFSEGQYVTTGESLPASEYDQLIKKIDGLGDAVASIVSSGNEIINASAVEFVLEGLHLNELLNKDQVAGRSTYSG